MRVQNKARASKGLAPEGEGKEPQDSWGVPHSKPRAIKRVRDGKSEKLGDLVTGM